MIIHHVKTPKGRKSSFRRLVNYLLNPQGKQERVGQVTTSNCHNTDIEWAMNEILATQEKNTRAKGDKTYHMVISFAPGESPSQAALTEIESKVVDSIGLSSHQRASVVHHDTDNLHVHVAINKIHPRTYTMVEPYGAYKKFASVAKEIEDEFGLIKTNHEKKIKKHTSLNMPNKASDVQIKELLSSIKEGCLSDLMASQTWDDLNTTLYRNGLTLQKRGNGFVFCDESGISVKASSISRGLSKASLEKRLGKYTQNTPKNEKAKRPSKNKINNQGAYSMDMYERYEKEKLESGKSIKEQLSRLSEKKKRLYEKAKKKANRKRKAIGIIGGGRAAKKAMHLLISSQYKKESDKIKKTCAIEREKILCSSNSLNWSDWLRKKVQEGDLEALNILRRKKKDNYSKYKISNTEFDDYIDSEKLDSVTKTGTLVYKMGRCTVKDNGGELNISRGISTDDLKHVLIMAKKKFGSSINISGSDLFKKTVVRVAVRNEIDVKFLDKSMEALRIQLTKEQENIDGKQRRDDNINRRGIGVSNVPTRGGNDRQRISGGDSRRGCRGGPQPHINRFRGDTAPQDKNSLRSVSELNVVQLPGGSEMLLPDNAHSQLEREGLNTDNKMRRGIFGWKLGKKGKKPKID